MKIDLTNWDRFHKPRIEQNMGGVVEAQICGYVYDSRSSDPIPGATVTISIGGFTSQVSTDEKYGYYQYLSSPEGPNELGTLTASCPGYKSSSPYPISFGFDTFIAHNFVLTPVGDLYILTGQVVDRFSRHPVANAQIVISPAGIQGSSGTDGTYRISGILGGQAQVTVTAPSYIPVTILIDFIGPNQTIIVDLVLWPRRTVPRQ